MPSKVTSLAPNLQHRLNGGLKQVRRLGRRAKIDSHWDDRSCLTHILCVYPLNFVVWCLWWVRVGCGSCGGLGWVVVVVVGCGSCGGLWWLWSVRVGCGGCGGLGWVVVVVVVVVGCGGCGRLEWVVVVVVA